MRERDHHGDVTADAARFWGRVAPAILATTGWHTEDEPAARASHGPRGAMMHRALLGLVAAALLSAACGRPAADRAAAEEAGRGAPGQAVGTSTGAPPAGSGAVTLSPASAPASAATPAPRAALQLSYGGGMGGGPAPGTIPGLTLWEDGRVAFQAPDRTYREAMLDTATVRRLLAQAALLHDLAGFYAATGATDAPSTFFAVEDGRGRTVVRVYGMDPLAGRPGEPNGEIMAKLRGLWRDAVGALPAGAPPLRPDAVVVSAEPPVGQPLPPRVDEPGCAALGIDRAWPKDLAGYATGTAAREAVRLGGLGPSERFCIDGRVHWIAVCPSLPVLSLPAGDWPHGGLPRHPAATAYDTGELYRTVPYRYVGVARPAMVAWYRAEMSRRGWRLARQGVEPAPGVSTPPNTRNTRDTRDVQVWVQPDPFGDPIVELRFGEGLVETTFVRVENGIPRHPRGVLGGCAGPPGTSCQLVRDTPLDETRAGLGSTCATWSGRKWATASSAAAGSCAGWSSGPRRAVSP